MYFSDQIPESLLRSQLQELEKIYLNADSETARFQAESGLGCPFGCGKCCEGFVPDILPLEAELVALELITGNYPFAMQIIRDGIDSQLFPGGRRGCPFYKQDSVYHCTVYRSRPLICRLFAFSSIHGKNGEKVFSPCREMDVLKKPEPSESPLMSDFASRLLAINPEDAKRRGSMDEQMQEALMRVMFIYKMGKNPDDDGPDIFPTMPKAG